MSILEHAEAVPVEDVQGVHASDASTSRPEGRRRRVSQDEAREIGRLYADNTTLTSEIRERFGIGDSSLYRIVQRQGIALRGRTTSVTRSGPPQAETPAVRRSRSSSANQAQRAVSQPRSTTVTTRARPALRADNISGGSAGRRAPVTEKTTSSSGALTVRTGAPRHQFRILFQAERVVEASDMQDALRQAQSFRALEITAVSRED